jgi:hypothetical protein
VSWETSKEVVSETILTKSIRNLTCPDDERPSLAVNIWMWFKTWRWMKV